MVSLLCYKVEIFWVICKKEWDKESLFVGFYGENFIIFNEQLFVFLVLQFYLRIRVFIMNVING